MLVHYVGVRSEDGTQFDTSYGGEPLPVTLGAGGVIAGWDEGLVGTTAGERVQLDIPNEMAYGDEARGDVIQAGDALSFVIDVLAVVPAADPATAVTQADIPTSAEGASAVETDDVRPGDGATLEEGMTGIFHLVAARRDDGTILQSTWDAMQPQPLTVTTEDAPAGPRRGPRRHAGRRPARHRHAGDPRQRAHAGDRRRHRRRPPRHRLTVGGRYRTWRRSRPRSRTLAECVSSPTAT